MSENVGLEELDVLDGAAAAQQVEEEHPEREPRGGVEFVPVQLSVRERERHYVLAVAQHAHVLLDDVAQRVGGQVWR